MDTTASYELKKKILVETQKGCPTLSYGSAIQLLYIVLTSGFSPAGNVKLIKCLSSIPWSTGTFGGNLVAIRNYDYRCG